MSPPTLAAWNARSLLENPRSNRPEWEVALVARKLAHHKLNIAALSEPRFFAQGQMKEVGAGHTFFCLGAEEGVGIVFAIRMTFWATAMSAAGYQQSSDEPLPGSPGRGEGGLVDSQTSNRRRRRCRRCRRRRQLRGTVQSTALAVLGRERRQYQDRFDDSVTAISNLLTEESRLLKAYVVHPADDNKAAFYRSRHPGQQWLREMQEAWAARKVKEIQGYADPNEWTTTSP
nr:unnamed protein product [Spirometra erinaceieuropaei]